MSKKLSYLWKVIVEATVIDRTINITGIVLSAASLIAAMYSGKEASVPWWLGLAVGMPLSAAATSWAAISKAFDLEEDRKPKIEITGPYRSPVHSSLQHLLTQYQIRITNLSYGTVTGCSVVEEAFGNTKGPITGKNRIFLQSQEVDASNAAHIYSTTFDLKGHSDFKTIEIAGYNSFEGKGVCMLYATQPTSLTPNYIPKQFFPHKLIILTTADNLREPIRAEYELGFDGSDEFYMKRLNTRIGDVLSTPV